MRPRNWGFYNHDIDPAILGILRLQLQMGLIHVERLPRHIVFYIWQASDGGDGIGKDREFYTPVCLGDKEISAVFGRQNIEVIPTDRLGL